MKCNIKLYDSGPRPKDKMFSVQYGVESKEGFTIDLTTEQIDYIKTATLDQVHEILNKELYKQTGIAYGEKPKD